MPLQCPTSCRSISQVEARALLEALGLDQLALLDEEAQALAQLRL